jgi:enoyl-CoA hydratase
MEYQNLLLRVKEGIAYLTLNRPDKLNSFNRQLLDELRQALDMIEADSEVKVVILTGAGRAFSAGYDISPETGVADLAEISPDEWRSFVKHNIDTFLKIWHSEKPYIAAINGFAMGGACELAQLCDIKIASDRAALGEPEIRFGAGPPVLITPFSIGLAKAKELLLTGDTLSAQQAEKIGMINRVVPHENLMVECEKTARKLINVGQVGMKLNKAAINNAFEQMGFLNTIYHNMELKILFDTSKTEESEAFHNVWKEKGLRAALDLRDSLFREEE